jgi:cytochrome-b5 reductase
LVLLVNACDAQVSLVFANTTPDDILLKEKLDRLASAHPNFKVFYVVDKPTEDWKGGRGYINKDVLLKALPSPSDDTVILVCGPPGLMKLISGDKAKDKSQGEVYIYIYICICICLNLYLPSSSPDFGRI